MDQATIYRDTLLEHYRHPRNRADPSNATIVRRGSNPRCGDDLEIGVDLEGDILERVRFRGRGCSLCIASASMMTEAVTGRSRAETRALHAQMRAAFAGRSNTAMPAPPEPLSPLTAVQQRTARHRCVMLAWEALADALAEA